MKMSRRGWNNIIIFAVAAMILVFKYVEINDKSVSVEASAAQQLLPVGATILRIELPDLLIERLGTEWRSKPVIDHPIAVVDAWLHVQLEPWPNAVGGAARSHIIQVYLANLASPLQLTLFELGDQRMITNWQGQLFQLDQASYSALFPHLSES
ncbi:MULTISPECIES: hypothetical protein [unclassified Agarivorans]|uniref:hypothetical protein n=1 Tax=unclassified Agarivorans TaxID=2636026 RepID=UPI003D7F04B6